MTVFLAVFAVCGWLGYFHEHRKRLAADTLITAQRDHLMALLEDSALLSDENAKVIRLNDRLLGLSVKLVTEADNRSVILPPPGGMVA
jgi:hypothetical protein